MENMVGGRGEAAGVGESKVGGNEKVRDVLCSDVAGDLLMAAGGAGIFEVSAGSIQTSLKTALRREGLVVPR